MKEYPEDLQKDWDMFKHEIGELVETRGYIKNLGLGDKDDVFVEVRVRAKHTFGDVEHDNWCTHGITFKINLRDMFLVGPNCALPIADVSDYCGDY
jgi:hypothetical protein